VSYVNNLQHSAGDSVPVCAAAGAETCGNADFSDNVTLACTSPQSVVAV